MKKFSKIFLFFSFIVLSTTGRAEDPPLNLTLATTGVTVGYSTDERYKDFSYTVDYCKGNTPDIYCEGGREEFPYQSDVKVFNFKSDGSSEFQGIYTITFRGSSAHINLYLGKLSSRSGMKCGSIPITRGYYECFSYTPSNTFLAKIEDVPWNPHFTFYPSVNYPQL